MTDIQLDNTGDIDISDYTMSLTYDLTESVKQRISIKLKFFKGEYFLDTTIGIPYFQQVFVKGVNKGVIDSIFKNAISRTDGVDKILFYTSTLNNSLREYSANWSVQLVNGDTVEGTI